jgi:hypothetical protein
MRLAIVVGVAAWLAAGAALAQDDFSSPDRPDVLGTVDAQLLNAAVPVGGALVFEVVESEDPIVQITRTDDDGASTSFGGTLLQLTPTYWSWTATSALEPGSYDVRISGYSGQVTAAIDVVDDIALDPPAIGTMAEARWLLEEPRRFSCQRWTGRELIVSGSFVASIRGAVLVAPGLWTEAPAEQIDQFLYRHVQPDTQPRSFARFSKLGDVGPYREQADEYCFGVELLDARTGEPFEHEVDGAVCAPHGDLPDLALDEVKGLGGSLDRESCPIPPDELGDEWCEHNVECADRDDDDSCDLYGYVCRGEELPERPRMTNAARDAGGEPDAGDEHDAAGHDDAGAAPRSERSGGCSAGGQPRAPSFGQLAALALLLAVGWRGRRGRSILAARAV